MGKFNNIVLDRFQGRSPEKVKRDSCIDKNIESMTVKDFLNSYIS